MPPYPTFDFLDSFTPSQQRDLQQFVSRLQGHLSQMGRWIDVEYNASNFRANGSMTWTVGRDDHITFSYMVLTKTLCLNVVLDTTTVGGTLNTLLQIVIPGGYVAAKKAQAAVTLFDNGTGTTAFAQVTAGSNLITIGRVDAAALSAATNATYVRVMMTFEVQ